jgi:hypothetical protein
MEQYKPKFKERPEKAKKTIDPRILFDPRRNPEYRASKFQKQRKKGSLVTGITKAQEFKNRYGK